MNPEGFLGKRIVITEKMDGENTTITRDYCHARSVDSARHESRNRVTALWQKVRFDIPADWRICGENLYAKHSIEYNNLNSYFLGFSIWNEENVCLSWSETQEWFELLGITPVSTLAEGTFFTCDEIRNVEKSLNPTKQEGYVIRLADAFHYKDFHISVAKYVRKNHVQSDAHWMHKSIIKNQLSGEHPTNPE
jgi:ATP-dependent RNA circularization protein (DNA/RNA ligase family)